MQITGTALENNAKIPKKYTCDAENVSPPLSWSETPEGTQSLALVVDDPDAPAGTWIHWIVWNIDPSVKEIKENSVPAQAIQGRNSFGDTKYGGPCPPSGTHRYVFKLYALDSRLDLAQGSDIAQLEKVMEGHVIDKSELIGLYSRE